MDTLFILYPFFCVLVGKVIVTILPLEETTDKTYEDVPAIADSIRDSMVEVYERTSAELAPTKLS